MATDFFLSALITYGPLTLGLGLFLGSMGLPIPTALLVLASGAFTRQGLMDLNTSWILCLAVAVLGDSASYALGRFAREWVQRIIGSRFDSVWQRAQERLKQYGGLTIYVTRFLLTILSVPTNLIAGSSHYAFQRFLAWDLAGRATWILLYGGLGYIFGNQWQAVSRIISIYGVWLGGAAALGIGVYYTYHLMRKYGQTLVAYLPLSRYFNNF